MAHQWEQTTTDSLDVGPCCNTISSARSPTDPIASDDQSFDRDHNFQPRINTANDSIPEYEQSNQSSHKPLVRVPLFEEYLRLLDFETGAPIPMAGSRSACSKITSKPRSKPSITSGTIKYGQEEYTQFLEDQGCIWDDSSRPDNYDDIIKALEISIDITDLDAKCLKNGMKMAENEAYIQTLVLPYVIDSREYTDTESEFRPLPCANWFNIGPIKDGLRVNSIPSPQPDLTIGLNADKLAKKARRVSNELGGYMRPVIGASRLLCPFFTVEIKGWQSSSLGFLQNMHNAAVMVRNLRKLRERAGIDVKKEFDNKAHVFTVVLAKSDIQLYCGWCREADDGKIEYRFTKLAACVNPSLEEVKKLISQIRNGITWFGKDVKDFVVKDIETIWDQLKEEGEEEL